MSRHAPLLRKDLVAVKHWCNRRNAAGAGGARATMQDEIGDEPRNTEQKRGEGPTQGIRAIVLAMPAIDKVRPRERREHEDYRNRPNVGK